MTAFLKGTTMKRRGVAWVAGLSLLGLFVFDTSAYAQYGKMREEGLSREDLSSMEEASKSLYAAATPKVGATASWKGEKTGNSGTVKLVQVYQYQGMPCRKLEHTIKVKDESGTRNFEADRCQVAGGEWKLRF